MAQNALKPISNNELAQDTMFSERQIELIKTQIMPGASDDDLMLFTQVASSRGLNPFMKHIYAVNYKGKWSYQVSIDGLRLIAQRSGRYRGQTEPQWCGLDGKWVDVWLKDEPPAAARVGVWIEGNAQPLMAVALYKNFVAPSANNPSTFWQKMPDHMLAKCAESQALRKAFPEEAGGMYTSDEMAQAQSDRPHVDEDGVIVEGSAREVPAKALPPRRKPQSPRDEIKLELWNFAKSIGITKEQLEEVCLQSTGDTLKDADEEMLRFLMDKLIGMTKDDVLELIADQPDEARVA